MTELLAALELHRVGIFVAFAMPAGTCVVIQWIFWIGGWGRFNPERAARRNVAAPDRSPIRFTLTNFMTEERRHVF
jgi:hypothetical protein